jgi:GAF domain-containing protein
MSDRTDDGARGRPSSSDTGRPGGEERLAHQLGRLARALQDEEDVDRTLEAIVHAVSGTVPGAQEASVSLIRRRREVETGASTGELPRAVDQAQYDTGQGPCLDSLYEHETVRVADMATERRWPEFARRATALGVGSMLSLQLFVRGSDLGALNLFSRERDAFSDDSERVGLLFAAHAGVALAGARQQDQLRRALDTRDLIGQAKGMLMERYRISADQAFAVLVRVSQAGNRKLVQICEELVDTGQVPADGAGTEERATG